MLVTTACYHHFLTFFTLFSGMYVQEVAGLTEKDIQSEILSPTAACGVSLHSSSTLSESQYTHVHKLFSVHFSIQVLLTLLM